MTVQLNAAMTWLADRGDFVFAALFLVILAILTVPVPPVAIDALVALNLAFNLVVLLTALYLKQVLDLSTFPSIILVATVFRLSVTVASTRLILAHGEAGSLIRGFGDFVVAGNVVVGLITFVILALVQFLVVTKGAERIAEVSARFTLDALPGKQLAIDNDVRNGALTPEEASRRRFVLERESQFFGAMDGAMRFVKGDSIASLAIGFVNLLGGLAIGMGQRGMDFSSALHVYTLLTVGEGLVSQIPAMLSSVAAAAVVTRVVTDRPGSLGSDIGHQVMTDPKTLLLAAAALACLGVVPGFPTAVLWTLAVGAAAIAWQLRRPQAASADADDAISSETAGPQVPALPEPRQLARAAWGDPILVRAHPQDIADFEAAGVADLLDDAVHREARRAGLSLVIPKFVEFSAVGAGRAEVVVEGAVVRRIQTAGLGAEAFADLLGDASRRYSGALFSIADVDEWLSEIERRSGRLVSEVKARVPLIQLVRAVRILLAEDVPLAHPRAFLEALLAADISEMTVQDMAEIGRRALMPQIVDRLTDSSGCLRACVLRPDEEELFASGAVVPADVERARLTLASLLEGPASAGASVLLLRRADRRRFAERIGAGELAGRILAFDDVQGVQRLEVSAEVSLGVGVSLAAAE